MKAPQNEWNKSLSHIKTLLFIRSAQNWWAAKELSRNWWLLQRFLNTVSSCALILYIKRTKLCFLKQGEHDSNCTIFCPEDMTRFKQGTSWLVIKPTTVRGERDKRNGNFFLLCYVFILDPKGFGCRQVSLDWFWLKKRLRTTFVIGTFVISTNSI